VILPAVLLLALLGRLLDHGHADAKIRPLIYTTAASALGGLLTPIGLDAWLLPLRLQSAGGIIVEWQKTELLSWPGYGLLLVGGLTIFLLGGNPRRSWVLFAAAVTVFGLSAVRNIAPAVLLLTPLLAALLDVRLGSRAASSVGASERRRLRRTAAASVTLGVALVVTTAITREQSAPADLPIDALAGVTRPSNEPIRLLNEYNWSGIALFYGPDGLKVGIDGRADYYGGDFILRYERALDGSGLDQLVTELDPTHALLRPDTAAVGLLEAMGWTVLEENEQSVLVEAP
jgi:hypothetical protein